MAIGMTRRELGRATVAGLALAGFGGAIGISGCGSDDSSGVAGEGPAGLDLDQRQEVIDRLAEMRVPKPVDFIRTDWSHDPLAFCSYSYLAPTRYGSEIRRMLAEPVGRIAFAGEATAKIPATVHGAIQAGRDAAKYAAGQLAPGARVAVVGAGAAGLSCAGELARQGLEPVLLEASDRVGGRVREADLDGSPVELGASWIHGVDGNPLTGLAGEAGIGLHPFSYQLDFPVPGQKPLGVSGEHRYWQAVNSFGPGSARYPDLPLEAILPRRRGPGLEWAIQNEVAQEYGADPDQLAALATWEGNWLGGGDVLLDGSYSKVVARLSGDAEVRFGFKVRKVSQRRGEVRIAGGVDADREEVAAEAVVITVPIGALKAGAIEFDPRLPAGSRTAISQLGAGLLDKVWLAFDQPFWPEGAEGFSWIDPRKPGRWGSWVNAVPVTGKPFLMTLAGGHDAHRLAGRSDLEVVGSAMAALEAMFG
ncbi:MAG: FAD-dependent oxidoreductase [Solirubrobacterales bacterium]|nr:FAD-dependent oxidoreductase [Solirubrobacterales bacterium]MCB8915911.1 FAD-dependent oxidoreductase [Thermoleophilales bacterium]